MSTLNSKTPMFYSFDFPRVPWGTLGYLGGTLGYLGVPWGTLGVPWGTLGYLGGTLGVPWGYLGDTLGGPPRALPIEGR